MELQAINTLMSQQNVWPFAGDIFKYILYEET